MTDEQKIQKFTQDVYLTRFNRFVDEIPIDYTTIVSVTDTDALVEIAKTISWLNMFLDELEAEVDNDGRPINWSFVRENDVELGTVSADGTIELDDDQLRLVVDDNRPLRLTTDGSVIANFAVVTADQITSKMNRTTNDRVTLVNRTLVFSRVFTAEEIGSTVVADVINSIPRLTSTDALTIDTVKPYQLLVLGVAKNATLPDIVQGGLSPSFVQRYDDLLDGIKAANSLTSSGDEYVRDDSSYISGVGF